MMLAGLQKTTLVDFPGIVAATVFTRGCSFRCGFCHNPELVIPEQYQGNLISEEVFFDFLLSRVGKLQGVCITGGEPLLQLDIDRFISHIKALGFKVKLDTNGSFPDRLKKIIQEGDVDYIAMDIKSPLNKYLTVTNFSDLGSGLGQDGQFPISNFQSNFKSQVPKSEKLKARSYKLEANIKQSIDLIMNSGIDYEFRTTVCHPYHTVEDFKEIGKMIKGARKYYIQNFVKSKHINQNLNFKPFSERGLKKSAKAVEKFVEKVDIR